ncbi:hypothetical protein ABXV18_26980 [Vibrio owensii]|uniref:hypothetical protein n=1 Tax=Vibrio owensii TaxID=696485 RepID=UPI003391DB48
MNHTLSKAAILAVGGSVAVLSAFLSYEFMNSLSPILGVASVLMEVVKFFCPLLVLLAWRQGQKLRAGLFAFITAILVSFSLMASVVAVDGGFMESRKQSEQYKAITLQIDLHQKTLDAMPSNYITKRNQLTEKIGGLLSTRASLQVDSVGSQYAREIGLSVGVCLELLIVAVSVALSLINGGTNGNRETVPSFETLVPPVVSSESEAKPDEIFHACETLEEKVFAGISARIFETPSVKNVRKHITGYRNDKISQALNKAGEIGLLVPRGESGLGWNYAN